MIEQDSDAKIILETLFSLSKIAASAKDLPSLWEPLFKIVLGALKVDAGTLMTQEGEKLVRRVAIGMSEEIMQEPPIPREKGGISWGVVETQKPAVITDLSKEKIASKALYSADMHSLVTVPMVARDKIVGVMSIFTRKERHFSQKDLHLFGAIANQAAMAIVSIRSTELLEENRQRLEEMTALNELSQSIATLFNFEETLKTIMGVITRMLRADKGVLTLFDHRDRLLKAIPPAFNLTDSQIQDFRCRYDEGITGFAFCKGIPIRANVLDSKTAAILKRAGLGEIKSVLASPLKVKSQTLGVIHVFSKRENNFLNPDLKLFSILSSQAAVVVSSSYMYREIEEERKKDQALLSSIGEGVLAVDQGGEIILFNTAGEQISGYLEEELLGKTVLETLGLWNKDKERMEEGFSPINQVLADGDPQTLKEVYLKGRDGNLFPAYLSIAPIRDADNKIIGAILVFRDISPDLEVEQMKEELISIATHELRTPITGIKGYLDMILDGDTGEINDETKKMIEEVVKINQRLADLVDDLLNVSRIEQKRIEIRPAVINFNQAISDALEELKIQAQDKKISLIFNEKEKFEVKADPERLRQVLINLIGNSIKYTPQGKVEISLSKKDQEIICSVKDSGVGMSKEAQKNLFEKFYRIRTEKTRNISGTGLGLWICRRLVEMMGGKIWVESAEGEGSKFSFSLPAG